MSNLSIRLRGSIWTMGLQGTGVVLAFASTWVLTQTMSPEGFGKFTVALAIFSIIALFALRGLDQLANRFIVEYSLEEDLERASTFEWWLVRSTVLGSFSFSLIACGIAFSINKAWLVDSGFLSMLVGLPFMNYAMMCRGRLIARRKTIKGQIPEQIIRPSLIILAACGMWVLSESVISPLAAGNLILLACISMAIWQLVICKPYRAYRKTNPTPGSWYRVSIPLGISYGTFLLMNRTDLLIIAVLLGDASAGVYAVAVRIAAVLRLPLFATQQVFSRDLVSAGHESRADQLALAARRTCIISGITSLLGLGVLLVVLSFVLDLFGPAYRSATTAVWILGLTHVIAAFLGPSGRLLGLNDGHKAMAVLIIAATTVNLALGWAMIPYWGIAAAAAATGISTLFWKLTAATVIKKRFGFFMPFIMSKHLKADQA